MEIILGKNKKIYMEYSYFEEKEEKCDKKGMVTQLIPTYKGEEKCYG